MSRCAMVLGVAAALMAGASAWGETSIRTVPLTLPWWTSTPKYAVTPGDPKPFSPVKDSQKQAGERTFETVVLENEQLRVQVVPELGGVIYRAVVKGAGGGKGRDMFFAEQRAKDWLPWWESGVKLSFPYYEHGLSTDSQPAGWRVSKGADGSVTLATFLDFSRHTEAYQKRRYGRFSSMFVTQQITVKPGDTCFDVDWTLHNPTPFRQGRRMWVDTYLPRTDTAEGPLMGAAASPNVSTAELVYPTTWVSDHGGAGLREFAGKTKIAGYGSGQFSLFAWEPQGFAGMYYPDTRTARLRITDPAAAPGAKFWFVGDPKAEVVATRPAAPNQMFNYVELWGGTDHIFEGIEDWIGPGEAYSFTYTYAMVENVGPVVYANRAVVVTRDPRDETKLMVSVLRQATTLRISAGGDTLFEYNGKLPASRIAAGLMPLVAGKAYRIEVDGKVVYEGPLPPAAPAKDDARHARIVESIKGRYNAEMRGNADEQGTTYHTAIKQYADGTTDKGRVLYRDGQLDAAIACLEKAVAATPEDGEAWHLLGVAKLEKGDRAGAKAALEKAVAAKRGYAAAHYYLAVVSIAEGDGKPTGQTRAHLDGLMRGSPLDYEGLLLAAWLDRHGQPRLAGIDALVVLAAWEPGDPRVVWMLAESGDKEAAVALAGLLKEPGAQKRIDDFVAATKGQFVPPARLK